MAGDDTSRPGGTGGSRLSRPAPASPTNPHRRAERLTPAVPFHVGVAAEAPTVGPTVPSHVGVADEAPPSGRPPHADRPVRRGRRRRSPTVGPTASRRPSRPTWASPPKPPPSGRPSRPTWASPPKPERRADGLTPAVPSHVGVAADPPTVGPTVPSGVGVADDAPPSRRPFGPTWALPPKPHRRAERLTPAVPSHVGVAAETPTVGPTVRSTWALPPKPHRRAERLTPAVPSHVGVAAETPTATPTALRRPPRPTWASRTKPYRRADRPVRRGRRRRTHRRAERFTPTVRRGWSPTKPLPSRRLSRPTWVVADETPTVAPTVLSDAGVADEAPPSGRPPHADRPVRRGRRRRNPIVARPSHACRPSHVGVAAEAPPSGRPSRPTWASPPKPHRRADRLTPTVLSDVGVAAEAPPSRDRLTPTVPSHVGVAAEAPPSGRPSRPTWASPTKSHRRADGLTPTVRRGRRRRSPTVGPTASRRPSCPTWASPLKLHRRADRPVPRGRRGPFRPTRVSPMKPHRRAGCPVRRGRRRRTPTVAPTVPSDVGVATENPAVALTVSRRPSCKTWASPPKPCRRTDRLTPAVL